MYRKILKMLLLLTELCGKYMWKIYVENICMCVCVCGWGCGGGGGQDIVGFVDEVALWLLDVAHVKAHVGVNTTHTTCIRTAPVLSQRAPVEHVAFCMLLSTCTQV